MLLEESTSRLTLNDEDFAGEAATVDYLLLILLHIRSTQRTRTSWSKLYQGLGWLKPPPQYLKFPMEWIKLAVRKLFWTCKSPPVLKAPPRI